MTEIEFKLKGWHALVFILCAALFLGFRYVSMQGDLNEKGMERIKQFVICDYGAEATADIGDALSKGQIVKAAQRTKDLVSLDDLTFKSISARGSGDDVVVRIELLVKGVPPTFKPVRYFKMQHSLLMGWSLPTETTWSSYYLKLF